MFNIKIKYDFGFKTLKDLDEKTRIYMNGFYVSSTVCTVGTVIALMRKRFVLAGLLAGLVVGGRYGAVQI